MQRTVKTTPAAQTPVSLSARAARRHQRVTCQAGSSRSKPEQLQQSSTATRAATLEAPPAQQRGHSREKAQPSQSESKLSWTKQWYPIQSIVDMDPGRPHAARLLGKEIVLWKDGRGIWRALEDLCSHRKVPLSEGRIEQSNGTLMCSFHGWCFDGEGNCTNIPTCGHIDEQAERNACSSSKAQVPSYPTQEKEGLLWVWGETGAQAFIHAFATPTCHNELFASFPEGKVDRFFDNYVRDVPGRMDVWIDNMTDQSHAQFAHNGAIGNPVKDLLTRGTLMGFPATVGEKPEEGVVFPFTTVIKDGKGEPNNAFIFKPPALTRLGAPAGTNKAPVSLWIYTTPTGANSTRLIINFARNEAFPKPPATQKGLAKLRADLFLFVRNRLLGFIFKSRWMGHLLLSNVDDGDQILLHKQSTTLSKLGQPWQRATFSPSSSDLGSVAFRRWWSSHGNNGPECADADQVQEDPRLGTDPTFRRQLLDRFAQHTHMCSACSGALKNVQSIMQAARYAAIAAGAALVIALGRGAAYISPLTLSLAILGGAALWSRQKLQRLERRFIFTDWVNAKIA